MRTAFVLSSLLLASCFLGKDDEGPDDEVRDACFWVVLQLGQGRSNVPEYGSRRLVDNETQCWTFESTTNPATDRVEFELRRVFEVQDGLRFGCEFSGSGNSLRAEMTEGRCMLRHPNGHLRMTLRDPVEVQLQNLRSTLLTIQMDYEEREGNILRRGPGVLSLASQEVIGPGVIRWQEDLDPRGPSPDPYDACPARPVCGEVDLEGVGVLRGDYEDDPGCRDWLENRVNYRTVRWAVTDDAEFDWEPSEEGGVFAGVRELHACTLTAWAGTAPQGDNYYRVAFDEGDAEFTMVLKDLWPHMGLTRYCEAEWVAPLEITDCP